MQFPAELVVPILGTVVWYLTSMAVITQALWSRYPEWLDNWTTCPARSGTWWCVGTSVALNREFLGFEARSLPGLVLAGLWGTFFVPLFAWALTTCLRRIH